MSTTSVLTIYPTALKVEEVLKAQARAGDPSLGHRLTTFPELIDLLDRETGGPPAITDSIASVLVHQALCDEGGERVGEHPGLAAAVVRALGELKAACLTPAMLGTLADAATTTEVSERLGWLGRVGAAYARRVADVARVDRHDRDRRVLELLDRHARGGTRPRALLGVTRLVIAEIYDYSPVQSLIASTLIRLVGDAELVTLAHPENVDASRFVERTWNRFVEDPAIADKVLPDFVVRGGRAGTLARVLANVFVEPKSALPPDGPDDRMRIVVAPSRTAEVGEIGRRLRTSLDAGVAPGRMAILVRALSVYRPLLEDVARRQRLPLVFHGPRPLAAHAGVHAVLRLLRLVVDGFPRDALAASLESPYFSAAPAGVRRLLATIAYVDGATLPLAPCLAHAEERYTRREAATVPPRVQAQARRALARIRRDGPAVVATVRRLATLGRSRTVAAHASILRALLAELDLTLPGTEAAPGEAPSEGAALTTLEQVLADLSELGTSANDRRVSLATFLAQLEIAIELAEVEAPGPHAEGVRVLAIADARGLDFDEVFLLGLDDGSFPTRLAEDGLLADSVRREVNRQGPRLIHAALGALASPTSVGRLVRTSGDRAAEDPFLFYLALSTAEQRIVVTYPARDDDGNALVRSPFIDELTAIVGEGSVEASAEADPAPAADVCADRGELLNAAVVAAIAGRPGLLAAAGARLSEGILVRLLDRVRVERRRAQYFLLDRARDDAAKEALADAFVGRLPADAARRDRLRAAEWSASRLDELGACGFRFFARRLLHLEEGDAVDEGLDGRETGTLVHRLLEVVLRRADPLAREPDAAAAHARAIAEAEREAIVAELRPADPRLFGLAWSQAVEAVAEVVAGEVERPADGRTRRRFLEWPFRFGIADHRGRPEEDRLDLTLAGTLDRADVWLDGASRVVAAEVLDYKNSKREGDYSARLDPARGLGTTSFQIPLYALALMAAADLTWAPDAKIAGGYILVRAGRNPLVRPLAPALLVREPEARVAAAEGGVTPVASRIVELVAQAVAGRFDVEPRECIRYCAYRHICRYEPPPEETE